MRVRNVVIGSSFLWRDAAKVGLHFLSEHLLARGCRLEWFTIPLSPLHFVKPRAARARARHLRIALRGPYREISTGKSLTNRVPITLIHPTRVPGLDSYWVSRTYLTWRIPSLAALARRDGVYPVDMVFFDCGGINSYYPFEKRGGVVVYRVSDLAAEFPGQVAGRIQSEQEIIRKADLLLPVSEPIYDEVVRIRGSRRGVHLLPNGVETDLFDRTTPPPLDYTEIPNPRAVFVGSVGSWCDLELVGAVARLRPTVSFCLIGRGEIANSLPSNVYLLGPRPHQQIPAYLQHATMGLIPFKDCPLTRKIERPLKFYEYISSGLPVVSVPYGAMMRMAPHALFGSSPAEFAAALDKAMAYTPQQRAWLRAEGSRFSWKAVYQKFDAILGSEGIEFP